VGGQPHILAALPPRKTSGIYCIGGWVGPRAGLEVCRLSHTYRHSIPGPSNP